MIFVYSVIAIVSFVLGFTILAILTLGSEADDNRDFREGYHVGYRKGYREAKKEYMYKDDVNAS